MKVIVVTASHRAQLGAKPGQTVEVEDGLAVSLIERGIAIPVKARKVERAVKEPEENAAVWHLKTSPADYLEQYPDGPNAELARRVLEQGDNG